MFDRFTDRARKVMGLARQEAQRFNHQYIGTEHILLGLIQEGSGVAANVFPYWGAYATSKAALEMLARTYAGETASSALKVNLLDPGVVRTAMRAKAMPGEDPETLPPPEAITGSFVDLAADDCTLNGARVRAVAEDWS